MEIFLGSYSPQLFSNEIQRSTLFQILLDLYYMVRNLHDCQIKHNSHKTKIVYVQVWGLQKPIQTHAIHLEMKLDGHKKTNIVT